MSGPAEPPPALRAPSLPPARSDAQLAALAAAYHAFYAEALSGSFGPPPPGEWTALRVVAHVGVNDLALAGVCRALLQRRPPTLDNAAPNDLAVLDAFVAAHGGDLASVVRAAQAGTADLLALLGRLEEGHLTSSVRSVLRDHGEIVVDGELEWGRLVLTVQTTRHLPAHTEQLRGLRR
jgi:hypothetical protein